MPEAPISVVWSVGLASQRLTQLGTGQDVLRDLLKSTTDNLQEVRPVVVEVVVTTGDRLPVSDVHS